MQIQYHIVSDIVNENGGNVAWWLMKDLVLYIAMFEYSAFNPKGPSLVIHQNHPKIAILR